MSFGGGGFGGFGSSNNQTTFGSGGGFGSNTGTGFGGNTTTTFGSKPFGATSTGGLFGGNTSTSNTGFGGFGSNTTNTTTFGSGGTSGGLFGASKPSTGFGGSTGSTLFGGNNTTGGFGTTNTTGGFGATNNSPFGGSQGPPANNGTASTPFNAFQEKDQSGTQQYQTITFQQPYQNYSLEELRLTDYNQGRRYGNQNGQAGAFGQSTGFGGFGSTTNNASSGFGSNNNTGGGLFGNNNNNSGTGFGNSNTNTTFGSTTNTGSGGLFGQNKPGGLFGSGSTSQPSTGGGLFGSSNTNTGGFGSGNTGTGFGSSTTGGGLFGQQNQNQTQSKPAFGGFGSNTNTGTSSLFGGGATNTGGGFGQSTNNTGGGLFGQQNQTSSAAPAFGSTQTSGTTGGLFGNSGSAFGQNQNQNQTQSTGGLFGGGGFGQNNQNQQKPGGLFGNTSTNTAGGGLFGQNNQTQQTGGLFGNAGTQNQSGGLFGSKPAAPATGGLFGNTSGTTNTSSGGGLFGNLGQNNQQQNTGTGLFGQSNQPKTGGLFGSSTTNNNTGSNLFGNLGASNNNTSTGTGLFGGSQTQQQPQQQQPMGSSLFGASSSSLLNTSMNTNPYGNDALFSGLTAPTPSPGPLATPLSSTQKHKKSAILPQHKLNPSVSTRLTTPQNRRLGTYGFNYSSYGTPGSASSASSPGYSSSLFTPGGLQRGLNKSYSTSNLRVSYNPETSILAPGAFSTTGRSFGGGSLKKLTINKSIPARVPLFDGPPTTAKRVSFVGSSNESATNGTNGVAPGGITGSEIVLREEPEDVSPVQGSSNTSSTVNGEVNGAPSVSRRPEMSQINGNNVVAAPEKNALIPSSSSSLNVQKGLQPGDPEPGQYYSRPSLEELRRMSPQELKAVPDFVIGRERIGEIQFNNGRPVDLSGVSLDKLLGDIVELSHRHASVYSEHCTVPKVPVNVGLNVPSRVILENSWPRRTHKNERIATSGLKFQKHVERLKRVPGTQFENYRSDSGQWIFAVPHFSSYGFDYDDEDEDMESSDLSSAPDTPAQTASARIPSGQMTGTPQEDSFASPAENSSPDDTFDFKKGKRKRASVPGGFGEDVAYEEEEDDEEGDDSMNNTGESFLGQRSVGSLDGQRDDGYDQGSESESVTGQGMAAPVSGPVRTTGPSAAKESDPFKDSLKPKSILKATQPLRPAFGTPSKGQLVFDDDWANQLQRTISPKKQDRQALRESQGDVLRERDANGTRMAPSFNGSVITTKMDLMQSLFSKTEPAKKRMGHGIELPYPKRPKTSNDLDELDQTDREFHSCNKPHFSENGTLIYAATGPASLEYGVFSTTQHPIIGTHKDIHFAKMPIFPDAIPPTLEPEKQHTTFTEVDGVPVARVGTNQRNGKLQSLDFEEMAQAVDIGNRAGIHEQQAWQLLSILFDDNLFQQTTNDFTPELFNEHKERFRKDKLSDFWESLVSADAQKDAQEARSAEQKAIAYLSGHNVADACHALLKGMDLRLATLMSQIGGDVAMRQDMVSQLDDWRRMDILSEMDEPVRALYELLAGNCAQAEGKIGDGRENKVSTFNIAQRFGLDWRRAFGLRLWYGTLVDEPIELAIAQFADALRDGLEEVKPVPWFVEQGDHVGWDDPEPERREDILWGILKLYASSKLDLPANVEEILAPENVSGHPLNARLSFQLFQLFKSRHDDPTEEPARKIGLPTVRSSDAEQQSFLSSTTSQAGDEQAEDPLVELNDKLTLTYAASIHTHSHWRTAAYVYTHLSSPTLREHYIRSLLAQFSHTYTIGGNDETYITLRDLSIPETWMHAAAALQAKTDGDDIRQVTHLIKAQELEDAHEVLCRSVGPNAIIARDYDALRELLGDFVPTPTSSPAFGSSRGGRATRRQKDPVPGWAKGGQIYFDYIHLLDLTSTREAGQDEINQLVNKLQSALEKIAQEDWSKRGLEERVALSEIAGFVAGLIAKGKRSERARVLKLPLTEDLWLRHTSDLSVGYYRTVMAGAK